VLHRLLELRSSVKKVYYIMTIMKLLQKIENSIVDFWNFRRLLMIAPY
jgi:hypothetical protein